MQANRTYVYIDGFNLFYGKLKGTNLKWLDLSKLCSVLLPKNNIQIIKYYTAKVKPKLNNPHILDRQQDYLRALETIPNLEIYYGHFLSNEVNMMKADGSGKVKVIKSEEKGTDVNIASHMLLDGFKNKYDIGVLISNDSDLLEPIRILRNEFKKKIGYINPQKNTSQVLKNNSDFMKSIRDTSIRQSQFPNEVLNSSGNKILKPNDWF
ncbi:NYN domain protein [Leptospira santarosai str. HAI134]|uniref:NYN domain-containing protein n=1 Tax=Leptospira santarosai TaxID=28183 RepID=UPI0002BDAEC4|nr:NYN domain-containing protein [Leptospira santarosai]EMO21510.1 NYN domain protein [Leptospira santarosai str. HAI134]